MVDSNDSGAGVDAALAQADALRRRGDLAGARRALDKIVDANPDTASAVYSLARVAASEGRVDDCIVLLERAARLEPTNVEYLARLADAHERAGETDAALAAHAAILNLDPENVPALMRSGALYASRNDLDRAAGAYQRVVLVRGPAAPALKDPDLPDALRRQLSTMHTTLSAKYRELLDETWQYLSAKYPKQALERIRLAFSLPLDERHRRYAHPRQRPEMLMFPGLSPRGWFERDEFQWVPRVEGAFETVLAEFQALRDEAAPFEPYIKGGAKAGAMTPLGTDFSSLAGNSSWASFHLNKAGRIDANCARCPRTAELMDSLPLAEADGYMPEIFFSVLAPGAHIVPHFGQMNVRLTVHVGLVVPPGCGLRVGDEERTWEPGRILAFDDSFDHEAWNRSESDRAVLIFEVWHPDLSDAEIDGLQHFFGTRSSWLGRYSSPNETLQHG